MSVQLVTQYIIVLIVSLSTTGTCLVEYVGLTGSLNPLYVGEGQPMTLKCNVTTTGIPVWVDPFGNTISSGCTLNPIVTSYITIDCDFTALPYYVYITLNETRNGRDNGTWTCTQSNSETVNVTLYIQPGNVSVSASYVQVPSCDNCEDNTVSCTTDNCVERGEALTWDWNYVNVNALVLDETFSSVGCSNDYVQRTTHSKIPWDKERGGTSGTAQCCLKSLPFNSTTCANAVINYLEVQDATTAPNTYEEESSSCSAGCIAGIVVSVVIVIAVVTFAVIWFQCREILTCLPE